jgi:predicted nucleic acid-binding protein
LTFSNGGQIIIFEHESKNTHSISRIGDDSKTTLTNPEGAASKGNCCREHPATKAVKADRIITERPCILRRADQNHRRNAQIDQSMAEKILMLDTSVLIDYFRKTDKSKSRLVQIADEFDQVAISSITEFEIYVGSTSDQRRFWKSMLFEVMVIPFDSLAAQYASEIQQDLKRKRCLIDKADLFIAATAIANDMAFDTLNRKHFERIEQLDLLRCR